MRGPQVARAVASAVAVVTAASAVLGGGCRQNAPQRPREVVLAEAVAEKVDAWRARREAECHREALAAAQALADSLIMDYAFAKRLELARPSRPIRPEEPPLLRPDDSLSMDPFRTDTLIRPDELPRRRPRAGAAAPGAPADSGIVDSFIIDSTIIDSTIIDSAAVPAGASRQRPGPPDR